MATRIKYKNGSSFNDIVLSKENGGTASTSSLSVSDINTIWTNITGLPTSTTNNVIVSVAQGGTGSSSAVNGLRNLGVIVEDIWIGNANSTSTSSITVTSQNGKTLFDYELIEFNFCLTDSAERFNIVVSSSELRTQVNSQNYEGRRCISHSRLASSYCVEINFYITNSTGNAIAFWLNSKMGWASVSLRSIRGINLNGGA